MFTVGSHHRCSESVWNWTFVRALTSLNSWIWACSNMVNTLELAPSAAFFFAFLGDCRVWPRQSKMVLNILTPLSPECLIVSMGSYVFSFTNTFVALILKNGIHVDTWLSFCMWMLCFKTFFTMLISQIHKSMSFFKCLWKIESSDSICRRLQVHHSWTEEWKQAHQT